MVTLGLVSALLLAAAGTLDAQANGSLERGAYVVNHVAPAETPPLGPEGELPGQALPGRFVISTPGFDAYAPNITPAAIGHWSDAELARAIREGIRPDGSVIGPPMLIELYRGMSDSDIAAIGAFLRTVPAVENDVPRSVYRLPLPAGYGPPVGHVADIAPGVTAEYGVSRRPRRPFRRMQHPDDSTRPF